jgi:hypothetical protein
MKSERHADTRKKDLTHADMCVTTGKNKLTVALRWCTYAHIVIDEYRHLGTSTVTANYNPL